MSTDLQTQIRRLAQQVESGQDPVTIDEVRLLVEGRQGTAPLLMPGSSVRRAVSRHGPWPAVVAAIVVVLLFGALAWLLPSDRPVPPADSFPPLSETTGYYMTSGVPDGFVLQDSWIRGDSYLLYLREFNEKWLPTDGGFAIHGKIGRPAFLSVDPDEYLSETRAAVPGSIEVEVAGRPGILYETEFSQDGLTAPLVWLLAIDDQGGVFEIVAVAMSRGDVLAVADGIRRIPVEDFVALGSQMTWDVRIDVAMTGFGYSPPSRVTELADHVDVALGVDLLSSRLAGDGGEGTVITTEDGQIVETFGNSVQASTADLYVDSAPDGLDEVLRRYPGSADLSPQRRQERVDEYIEQVGESVLSEDPYVIQATPGPEPRFDVNELGEELPFIPAATADVVPPQLLTGTFGTEPATATEERPVIVMGTTRQPESDGAAATALVWFTPTGLTCEGIGSDEGMGSACGFEILSHFGLGEGSTTESEDGVLISGDATYVVPLESSVVQIVAQSQTYWQRPLGGYGVISFGDTVDRPTTIIAYDADGNELGNWSAGSR